MLKLRLKRYGKKREPSYRIIAIESRSRRQARPLEELGFYNPRTKETVLETAGLLKWLRQGAQPTETLESILRKAGILEMLKAGKGVEGDLETLRIPAIAKVLPVLDEEEADTTSESAESVTVAEDVAEDPSGEDVAADPVPAEEETSAEATAEEPEIVEDPKAEEPEGVEESKAEELAQAEA